MARDAFEIRTEVKRISRHLNILSDTISGRAEKQDMDAEQVFVAIDELRNNLAELQGLALNMIEGAGELADPHQARQSLRAQFREVTLLVDVVRRRGTSTSRLVNDILGAAAEMADLSDHLVALDNDLAQLVRRDPAFAKAEDHALESLPEPLIPEMKSDEGNVKSA